MYEKKKEHNVCAHACHTFPLRKSDEISGENKRKERIR